MVRKKTKKVGGSITDAFWLKQRFDKLERDHKVIMKQIAQINPPRFDFTVGPVTAKHEA